MERRCSEQLVLVGKRINECVRMNVKILAKCYVPYVQFVYVMHRYVHSVEHQRRWHVLRTQEDENNIVGLKNVKFENKYR